MTPNDERKQFEVFIGGRTRDCTPMARTTDPATSHEAAEVIRVHLSGLQQSVLIMYRQLGPMTAKQAEDTVEFSSYSPSTIRKRISELAKHGFLVEDGVDRSGRAPSIIYKIP